MPKMRDTRKQRAAELLDRLKRGPSFSSLREETPEGIYRLWVESWIIAEVKALIPELKEKR